MYSTTFPTISGYLTVAGTHIRLPQSFVAQLSYASSYFGKGRTP